MTEPTTLPIRRQREDDDTIEHDIRQLHQKAVPKLEDLGRMSGEAVMAQYEAAAKAVEEMGVDVKKAVQMLGAAVLECDTDLKHLGADVKDMMQNITGALTRCDADLKFISETAGSIRDKGQVSKEMVEKFSEMSKAIREACNDFKNKMEV